MLPRQITVGEFLPQFLIVPGRSHRQRPSNPSLMNLTTMNLTIPDPVDWFPKYFKTGVPENRTGYSDPKLDALVERLIKAEDTATQKQAAVDLQRILMEDRPIIVEGWNDFQDGYWDSVKNMFFAQSKLGNYDTRIRLDQVWLER